MGDLVSMTRRLALWCVLALLVPAVAMAEPVRVCAGATVDTGGDGRLLGHLRYDQAAAWELRAAPPGFALGQPCRLHRGAAAALADLLDAARSDGVTALRGVSCFRSIERQREVFCGRIGPGKASRTAADRARSVGPPGFSEHATGYALDFGIRPSPGCPDLDHCIAASRAGRWLLANAPAHGFELSFPSGNDQGVTWEPWHWRWVGSSTAAPGALAARALFARARGAFHAFPAVRDAPPPSLPPPIEVEPFDPAQAESPPTSPAPLRPR